MYVPELGSHIDPYLVKSTPPVLSVGMRCIDQGYDFIWKGSKNENPYFRKPDGTKIEMVVDDYVPYIPSSCHVALPAVEDDDIISNSPDAMQIPDAEFPPAEESPEYEPSIAPPESENEIEELVKEVRDLPNNPFCDVCNKSKMIKPPSLRAGGSSQVESETFGQHLTGDFLVTKDSEDLGIDNEKVALVLKDVATDFRYVYPSARRDSREVILAFKHFLAQGDKG